MRAAAALLLMRPSSGSCDRGERGLVADALDGLQEPLGVAQIVALPHEVLHGVMQFPVTLAKASR